MEKKYVCINARFLTQQLTGVQRFAFELSSRIKEKYGKDVVFLAPRNIVQYEMAAKLNVKCIGKMTGYAWEQVELPIWLWTHGSPKLINFCSVAPLLYRNNYVAVHDITWVKYPETYSSIFRLVYNFLIPRVCRKAKQIMTVSEFSKKEISSFYNLPQNRFSIIYNGVDDAFHPVMDKKLKDEQYILAVSSVKANKNFIMVLKAFCSFHQKAPNIKLYIIGDCESRNFKLIEISEYKKNDSIKFIGRVSDEELIKYYSNALGLVFLSLYEGFGIPVLEAQACGCPVLASNIESLKEVLGESALFCQPLSIDDIVEKMRNLIQNADVLRCRGYDNVKRFSWDKSAERCIRMLLE